MGLSFPLADPSGELVIHRGPVEVGPPWGLAVPESSDRRGLFGPGHSKDLGKGEGRGGDLRGAPAIRCHPALGSLTTPQRWRQPGEDPGSPGAFGHQDYSEICSRPGGGAPGGPGKAESKQSEKNGG